MEHEDYPEELNTPPEKRLVGTLITQAPSPGSFLMSAITCLFIVLVTQLYWIDFNSWANYLPAVNRLIFEESQWWRLFTSVLIHGDLGHLASNLYMLSIFSYFVFGYFGWQAFPLLTFLGSGLVNLVSISTYPPDVRLLGASGLVYLLGGFWLTLYFVIQRQYRVLHRTLRVCGMALMVFFPTSFEATTSYRSHFIGFVVGLLLAIIYFYRYRSSIRAKEVYRYV